MDLASQLGCYCVFFPESLIPRIPQIRFIAIADDPDAIASSYFEKTSCDCTCMTNVCLQLPNVAQGLNCVVYHQDEAGTAFNYSASEYLTRRFCGPVLVLGLNRELVRHVVLFSANLAMAVDMGFQSNFTNCSEAPPDGCDDPEDYLREVEQKEQETAQRDEKQSLLLDLDQSVFDFKALTVLTQRSAALRDDALLAHVQFIVVRDLVPEIELMSFLDHRLFLKLRKALKGTAKRLLSQPPQKGLSQHVEMIRWAGNAFLLHMGRVVASTPDEVCCSVKSTVEANKRYLTGQEIYQLVVERMDDLGLTPNVDEVLISFSARPEIRPSKTLFGRRNRKRQERREGRWRRSRSSRSLSPGRRRRSGVIVVATK
jgi:hypothetical protein